MKFIKRAKVKAASLIEDMSLYPRHHVDDQRVTDYIQAKLAGAEFPPVTANVKDRTLSDGWHRNRMCQSRRIGGVGALIEVNFWQYDSKEEQFLHAVRLNASHGEPLTHYDRRRIVVMCEEFGISAEDTAQALNITLAKFKKISDDEIHRNEDGTANPGKRPDQHLGDVQVLGAERMRYGWRFVARSRITSSDHD